MKRLNNQCGVALILILWVMTLLGIIASEFTFTILTESMITRNFKEESESYYLALSGFSRALMEIMQKWDFNYLDENGNLVFGRLKEFSDTEESPREMKNVNREDIKMDRGTFSYSIVDEESKLNINALPREKIIDLLRISGIELGELRDSIADSILDWIDSDELYRLNGAETDYYQSLPVPYISKNGILDTPEELLLIKGMRPGILYGMESDGDRDRDRDKDYMGIFKYITTYGAGQVNLNTADDVVLKVFFGENYSYILSRRAVQAFFNPQLEGGIVKSSTFSIESTGMTKGGSIKRTIRAVIKKEGGGKNSGFSINYWNDNYIPGGSRRL